MVLTSSANHASAGAITHRASARASAARASGARTSGARARLTIHMSVCVLASAASATWTGTAGAQPTAQRSENAGWLGFTLDTESPASYRIGAVEPGSPADKAGVRAGDNILSVNNLPPSRFFAVVEARALESTPSGAGVTGALGASPGAGAGIIVTKAKTLTSELKAPAAAVTRYAPHDTVRLRLRRDGWERTITLVAVVPPSAAPLPRAEPFDFNALHIKSIELIKGSAAVNLYGKAAANGVVVINTDRVRALSRALLDTARAALAESPRRPDGLEDAGGAAQTTSSGTTISATLRDLQQTPMSRAPLYIVDGVIMPSGLAWDTLLGRRDSTQNRRGEPVRTLDPSLAVLQAAERGVAGAEFVEMNYDLGTYFAGVTDGLLVVRVSAGTPASNAGLKAGDVVRGVGNLSVRTMTQLRAAVGGGTGPIALRVVRRGMVLTLTVPRG
jgi:S1-C subfamily serine protease